MKKQKKKSLLVIVGLLTFTMFVLSSVLNAVQIYESYTVLQMRKMQEQTKEMTDYVGNELMSYKAVSWLFTYWENHYDEMDIPLDALTNEKWISDHSDYYSLSVKNMSAGDIQLLPENEQKKIAETCYILNAAFFDRLKREYNLVDINCTLYHEGEEAFAFFKGLDDNSSEKNYVLGEMWAFHAELHPVAARIYNTGEDISEIERATSTTDGWEYIFVYTPVIADGELRGLICGTHLWSTVKDEISSGVRGIEIFNFIFLFVTNNILLILLYFLVIKPLSNMQNSVSRYKESKNSSNLKAEIGKITETSNEIGLLASDISDMAEEIDRYINEVRTVTAEKERMAKLVLGDGPYYKFNLERSYKDSDKANIDSMLKRIEELDNRIFGEDYPYDDYREGYEHNLKSYMESYAQLPEPGPMEPWPGSFACGSPPSDYTRA
mgnify:CR=1 FL=1